MLFSIPFVSRWFSISSLTALKSEIIHSSQDISNKSLIYHSASSVTSGMIWRNPCRPKAEYSAFKTIRIPVFCPLDCEINLSLRRWLMGDYQQRSPGQYFQIYVASIKWPHFPKLEPSMSAPGLQVSAATSAVTTTSKRFYCKPTGNAF